MNLQSFKGAIAVLSILLFTSCTSERKVLDSYLEHNIREVIMKLGPPAQVTSDGSNGKIYVFSESGSNPYNGYTTYHYIFFYAYTDGTIYHWLAKKGSVPPERVNVDLYVH